jgi:ribosome-associated protein
VKSVENHDALGPLENRFLVITASLRIPLDEFSFTFSRSGGPGGQNVNKVTSKAQLRWPVADTPSLPDEVRRRFIEQNRHRITTEGDFLISSQRYRDQPRNISDCKEKLQALLARSAARPVPRRKTKPTAGSRRRRLTQKRRRSATKDLRRNPTSQE